MGSDTRAEMGTRAGTGTEMELGMGAGTVRDSKTDRRIRKTRAALKHSLTTLLQRKNIKDITVKEITELADVNRGTFYLHYKDVFDLLEQSENDLFNGFLQTLDAYAVDEIQKSPVILFQGVYQLCLENADLIRILIGENGDIKFLNKLQLLLREKCLNDWGSLMKKRKLEHFDAYFSFLVGGCVSLLQHWFKDGMKESPAELAEITGIFLDGNL